MRRLPRRLVLLPVVLACSLPLTPRPARADANEPDLDHVSTPVRPLVERFTEDRDLLRRSLGIPMSSWSRERLAKFHATWSDRLGALDFSTLDADARVDYVLMKRELRQGLRELERRAERDREVQGLLPYWSTIVELEQSRRRFEPVSPREAAGRLEDLATRVDDARLAAQKQLEADTASDSKSPLRPTLVERAIRRLEELRRTLSRWYEFREGYDPLFTWWAREPYSSADNALEQHLTLLRDRVIGKAPDGDERLIGDPIGADALRYELDHELIPYSAAELIEIARREFAWCEARMLEASRELGHGDDWRKALDHVKSHYVAPGEQPALIRELALEAVRFLEERELVTIPELCKTSWRMIMMSPERQKVNPYFTGGEVISVSFPTDDMTHEQKLMSLRSNNIHFCRATVHHELIPGHHLQLFMSERYKPYRRIFRTPFLVEGWALYWEMLLWDLGFASSPEDRIGMLFWRLHRCARIIVSLGFHLERMEPSEMVDFLIERVGHEPDAAEAEVRRYIAGNYGPLYQCAYMLGGLQLRALRKELVESGKMSDREFHDAVLRENAIPVELIRARLLDEPLAEDHRSTWRFAGD